MMTTMDSQRSIGEKHSSKLGRQYGEVTPELAESTCSGEFMEGTSIASYSDDEFFANCMAMRVARRDFLGFSSQVGVIAPPPGLDQPSPLRIFAAAPVAAVKAGSALPEAANCCSARNKLRQSGNAVLNSVQPGNPSRKDRTSKDGNTALQRRSCTRGGRNAACNQTLTGGEFHQPAGCVLASERHAALLRVLDSRKVDKEASALQFESFNAIAADVPRLRQSARIAVPSTHHGSRMNVGASWPRSHFQQHDMSATPVDYDELMKLPASELLGVVVSL